MNRDLTSYCGLCCADCIPSNDEFFQIVSRLEEMLGTLQFEHYAEHKSKRQPVFKEYRTFLSVLHQIKALQCSAPCRRGGGNPDCAAQRVNVR